MRNIVLTTKNLTKKYNNIPVLSDINMELKQGEIYGLVGKNGAGKTTLLRLITGQTFPTEGEISLFHVSGEKALNKERKRIGAIIESPSFYSYLSAEQNLEYYRVQRSIPGKNCIKDVLKEVGLSDAGNKRYKSFSLGMKQRLGIALALLNNPEILLLDEPINGLDPFGIVEIRNLMLKLSHEKNITILISSHILSELSNLVTNYGFIHNGILLKQLSHDELSKECSKYLEVRVDQVEKMTALLEKELSCTSYKVTPEYAIRIYDYLDRPAIISRLAVNYGIELNSIQVQEMNLENYFIQLVGGLENGTIY
ncbi:ABC transporter ATP-binding protein [Anaerocolumna sp. MB42-C2]|uniref:ABC transporter ATP-binding protein n=1 Tax=Anaerocolumna sp. MB42-C2 TaxID=3070997 RepID=UPI0027E213D9|nr:ATP-binding cassette domain-containing protein [Anaerocolumna sp. MB42-C2]WMJ87948.1 ATP-binding cassette domain-containing protein [Anaerocolumna sp. MB42-C2]